MHQSIYRERENAKGIVIFIHGFFGSPNQFSDWAEAAFDAGYSVAALLLPGHGAGVEALLKSGAREWVQHAQKETGAYAAKYERVFLVGHSIGGLIALQMAATNSFPIAGVVVIAAPLKFNYFALHSLLTRLRLSLGRKDTVIKKTYLAANSVSGLGVGALPAMVHSVFEIKKLVRSTHSGLAQVISPVLLIYSKKDETVSFQSMSVLESSLAHATTTSLSLSSSLHAYYVPGERIAIGVALCRFLEECLPCEPYSPEE